MTFDLSHEKAISLSEAAQLIPARRGNKPTHPATITKWITVGYCGIKLDAIRLGGRWATSHEAIQRFAEACAAASAEALACV
jgi:hypothetical protein